MEMKINIKKLLEERNKRAWTQAHLAEVCGLSLRTIQRIEKSGVASNESIQSLSSVFEIPVENLVYEKTIINTGSNEGKKANFLARIGLFLIMIIPIIALFTAISGTTIWVDTIEAGINKKVSTSFTLITLLNYTKIALYTILPGVVLILVSKYIFHYKKPWINKTLIMAIVLLSFANPIMALFLATLLVSLFLFSRESKVAN